MAARTQREQMKAADAALVSAAKAITAARKALAAAIEQTQGLGNVALGDAPLGE